MQLAIEIKFSGELVQPATLRYANSAGETFSITRVSYLLSGFALQRTDGSWLELTNQIAWLDFAQVRSTHRFPSVSSGEYRSLRFHVGLDETLNHADPAQFAADHPLNPILNGLHWSWQGGYIFLALEGLWRKAGGAVDGWSYHLGRDTNAVRITLATPLTVTNETRVELDFDFASLLNAPHTLSFGKDGTSTHSRDGDPISAALVANLPSAFRVHRVYTLTETEMAIARPKPLYLPEKFTPYPFQMSATFPSPDLPRDNPLTVERLELGKTLFFDKRVSINDAQSCADCHAPEKAFTEGRRVATGAEGDLGTRNAMPLFNLAWKKEFFWDGRAKSLREQVLQPIQNPMEMHQSLTNLVVKLQRNGQTNYPALFTAAFGSPEITPEKITLALENYLLTLTSFDAKFDRVLRGEGEFAPEEKRGFELFFTEYAPRRGQFGADCFHCHGGPLFQSQAFANNGLDAQFKDRGRAQVTGRDADLGKFATASLRNVALTAPYMHDGRFSTLEEVVAHYSTGLRRSDTLDPKTSRWRNRPE